MIRSLLIAIGLTVVMALAWVLVQTLWKHAFKDEYYQEDVLAGRRSCSNCGCTTVCANKKGQKLKTTKSPFYREITKDQLPNI